MYLNAEDSLDILNPPLNDEQCRLGNPPHQLLDRAEIRLFDRYEANFVKYLDPNVIEEAVDRADSKAWEKAISEELTSLEDNGPWEIVSSPPDQHAP